MMQPTKVEYDIGKDRYGRRTRLISEKDGGQVHWSIISDPVSQRDEGEHIRSLTSEQLRAIASVSTAN